MTSVQHSESVVVRLRLWVTLNNCQLEVTMSWNRGLLQVQNIRLNKFKKLQFAFNFPSSPVKRPTVYNAKEISPKKKSSFWKTLQNSSCKIPICLQFSFAHVSHVWRLQPWRRKKKKKLVQTSCPMRKSFLKHRGRLQVAVNIRRQSDALSGA